jgi:hypothetical protein
MTASRVALLLALLPVHSMTAFAAAAENSAILATTRSSASPTEASVVRTRRVSTHVAEMLAAATPKYDAPAPTTAASEVSAASVMRVDDTPANHIVRLSPYIVRERKLPTPDEVDRRQLERRVMEQYLGPENGFDRGFLNLITAKQFPLLAFFGSMSNEARAMMYYQEDERIRVQNDLQEMVSYMKMTSDAALAAKAQRELKEALRRD